MEMFWTDRFSDVFLQRHKDYLVLEKHWHTFDIGLNNLILNEGWTAKTHCLSVSFKITLYREKGHSEIRTETREKAIEGLNIEL